MDIILKSRFFICNLSWFRSF